MTKYFALLILTMFLPSLSVTQTESPAPYLTDSSRSIQFGIGLLTLRSFDDNMISYRQHFSASTAVRFGVSLSGDRSMEERHSTTFHGDTIVQQQHSRTTRTPQFALTLRAQYQWFLPVENDLYLVAGVGPEAGYSEQSHSRGNSRFWSAGLHGGVGAEWFASRHISLHAEYLTAVLYRWNRSSEWDYYDPNATKLYEEVTRNITLNSMSVLFGLSVYF